MKTYFITAVLLITILFASCSSSDKTVKVAKTPLKKTNWTLYQLGGNTLKSDKDVTINFSDSDDKTFGNAPCNNFTGAYILSGKSLSFKPLAVTKKMCPDLENEDLFLKSLQNTASYKISGSELNLFDSNGSLLMIFRSK